MKVSQILAVTAGRLIAGSPARDIDLARISTDTRTMKKGDLFLALSGPNFCGTDFAEEALRKGAIGAIVERRIRPRGPGKVVIQVRDATAALQAIAAAHRSSFAIPVVCVTGSNGKTTVKDMIAAVLSVKYCVLSNEGTKNNHIGVPQTLLKLTARHEVCVLELGTNHRGEIRSLARLAKPDIAVITNIGPSHLEFLGDLEGVCREKRQLVSSLGRQGVAVLNGDDPFLAKIKSRTVVRYGFGKHNDIRGRILAADRRKIDLIVNGRDRFRLFLVGSHNAHNALAAMAVARLLDLDTSAIRRGLAGYRPTRMRLAPLTVKGVRILNDAYNSNPLSMATALEAIRQYPARERWVVSGDMLELGTEALRFHEMAGERAARSAIRGLLTFGDLSKYTLAGARKKGMDGRSLWHCSSHGEIAAILKKVVKEGDVVLVKGSRGMRMEKVIEEFKK